MIKICEVIKKRERSRNIKEYFQDKCSKKWNLIDLEAREGFTSNTQRQIKCAAELNMHGERIKVIGASNKHACCPLCEPKEKWEHVVLCEKRKNKKDDQIKKLIKKLNDAAKKVKVSTYETNIFNEIIKDVWK